MVKIVKILKNFVKSVVNIAVFIYYADYQKITPPPQFADYK